MGKTGCRGRVVGVDGDAVGFPAPSLWIAEEAVAIGADVSALFRLVDCFPLSLRPT